MSTSTTPGVAQTAQLEPHRAWEEYLRSARQLDAVRRTAAGTVAEQPPAVRTAEEELTRVRARLLPQRSRLRLLGVPESALQPSKPEVAVAARGLADGPDAVLAAVRRTGVMADAVDTALSRPVGPAYRQWLPRLLVFGPLVILSLLLICGGLAMVWIMR